MQSIKSRKKLYHLLHPLISIIALVCVVIFGVLLLFTVLKQRRMPVSPKAYIISIPQQISSPIPTSFPMKTFTSHDLGIRFTYAASTDVNGGIPVNALQEGNKVYVYETDQRPESSMYVEIFPKNSADSITDAIKKRILQGY